MSCPLALALFLLAAVPLAAAELADGDPAAVLLASTPTSTVDPKPRPPGGCAVDLVAMSSCLPYVAASPPYTAAPFPSAKCCEAFASSMDGKGGGAACIGYLACDPYALGFPINASRLFSLFTFCGGDSNSLNKICGGGLGEAQQGYSHDQADPLRRIRHPPTPVPRHPPPPPKIRPPPPDDHHHPKPELPDLPQPSDPSPTTGTPSEAPLHRGIDGRILAGAALLLSLA